MPKFSELTQEEELGSGVSRIGYSTSNPKLVIKEARTGTRAGDATCKMANLIEVAIWNTVKGTDFEELFVPILASASDGSWVIMPRVVTVQDSDNSKCEGFWKKTDALYFLGIVDLHDGNMTPDGKCLDYSSWGRYDDEKEVVKGIKRAISHLEYHKNSNYECPLAFCEGN